MYSHAPNDYKCPFCRLIAGEDMGPNGSVQGDIVYRDARVAAIIASKWWRNNKGHILVRGTGWQDIEAEPETNVSISYRAYPQPLHDIGLVVNSTFLV